MPGFDGTKFGQEMVEVVKTAISNATAPLLKRIDALEMQLAGIDLKASTTAVVVDILPGELAKIGAELESTLRAGIPSATDIAALVPRPENGKDGAPGKDGVSPSVDDVIVALKLPVAALLEEVLAERSVVTQEDIELLKSTIPAPIDTEPLRKALDELGSIVAALPSVEKAVEEVRASFDEALSLASGNMGDLVKAATAAQNEQIAGLGKRIDEFAELVEALPVDEKVKEAVGAIDLDELAAKAAEKITVPEPVPGRDGVGLAGALIDRHGNLVVTLSNGETKDLGPVVGRDGQNGQQGTPGQDGVSFDDMDVRMEGRSLIIAAERGENKKTWTFGLDYLLDAGIYKEGTEYVRGDGVTWGGSFWIAQTATKAKPGTTDDWRLAVKKGRDGKDGKVIEPPKPVKLAETT